MMPGISRRFVDLWRRVGATGDPVPPLMDLLRRYGEPHRRYHTIAHIAAMLREFDDFLADPSAKVESADAIELAIWFHDAVYDTAASDNEEVSAELFRSVAEKAGLEARFADAVARLIVATKHGKAPRHRDARALCDIDLSIFGRPEKEFDDYETGIRLEYGWVPEREFLEARMRILGIFERRANIYSTMYFREYYQDRARANLKRSIAMLGSRLGSL